MSRKIWGPREEYQQYVKQAKHLFPTLLGNIHRHRIFLCGFIAKHSKHVAKIRGNKNPWAVLVPDYDYAIEFWDPRFSGYSEAKKIYVVVHELIHIPPMDFQKGSPDYRKCLTHDVEDFSWMLDVYGIHMEKVDRVLRGEEYLSRHGELPKQFKHPTARAK